MDINLTNQSKPITYFTGNGIGDGFNSDYQSFANQMPTFSSTEEANACLQNPYISQSQMRKIQEVQLPQPYQLPIELQQYNQELQDNQNPYISQPQIQEAQEGQLPQPYQQPIEQQSNQELIHKYIELQKELAQLQTYNVNLIQKQTELILSIYDNDCDIVTNTLLVPFDITLCSILASKGRKSPSFSSNFSPSLNSISTVPLTTWIVAYPLCEWFGRPLPSSNLKNNVLNFSFSTKNSLLVTMLFMFIGFITIPP